MWLYAIVFALAVAQCYLLTGGAIIAARHVRLLDWPDKERKLHARATPLMGGVAVISALLLGVLECLATGWEWIAVDAQSAHFTMMLLNSAGMLCALGLWDDKFGMRARNKLLLQIIAILPFVWWGRATTAVDVFGWHLDLAWLGVPLTLLWLVSCTNFVNLVDGLDGLASTVGLVVSLTVAVLASISGLTGILCVAVILSGALVGFLLHNWPPARIFLGDSGSLPLGFLVGALAIEASVKKAAGLTLAVPFVLLSIPMFDTSMAILRRKLNGRKIGQGDRAHIHHILRDRGLTPTQTLLAIGTMCLATASAAVLATLYRNDLIAVALCGGLLALLVVGRVFGFNEAVLLTRHVQAVWTFVLSVPQTLRWRFLVARLVPKAAEHSDDYWHQMVRRMKRMNGLSLEFACENRTTGETVARMTWATEGEPIANAPRWELSHTATRPDGLDAILVARGAMSRAARPVRLNELLELFAAFCAHCSVDANVPPGDPTGRTIHPPHDAASEPHIIAGKWKPLVARTGGGSRADKDAA